MQELTMITPGQLHESLNSKDGGMLLVDVRSTGEFASGHIPQSQNLPLDQLDSSLHALPRDKRIVLSCRSGQRSRVAREFLHSRGFQNLSELEGGYSNWRQQGLPINAPEENATSSSRFNMSRFFG